jgi:Arc/MetJ family transcription regulator
MTTITLDDQLIEEVISVSHYQNAQEAVVKILAEYLRQQKARSTIVELLAMPDAAEIDFNPPRLTMAFRAADLS